MGKVYRATDTNLKRTVAIKVLPEAVATDAERVARFQREAEVLARLNHPNIAQIHGLEKTDGTTALVMELVEGPTLADRIAQGPIPIDEALPIAQQIIEALEAAHERGIVHRDLKPANIKLRPDGTVKVLDFGLAKALEPMAADTDTARGPTVTSPAMTRLGVILGTAAYMSPEQARGRAVDKRSDVWAFGCVMFEMLTGRQLFGGEDVTESIASIVRGEPDWGKLPSDTPAAIRRLLRRCVAKDPKERLMDIGVARLEIKDALTAPFSEASEPAARLLRARLPWFVAALSVAVTLGTFAWSLQRHPAEPFPMRFEMVPPRGLLPSSLAFSPDGKQLAFVAPDNGVLSLWVRRLDQDSAHSVPGTNDASFPFWAPDGRAIGFFANGKLYRIDSSGGAPLTLADVAEGRGGSWSQDGVILFAPALGAGLMRVAANGGVPLAATKLSPGQRGHRWPQFLPDGRHFLFSSLEEGESSGLFLASLDGNPPIRLLDGGSGVYASGHLVFGRGDTLNAAPFDVERMKLTGDSVMILQGVADSGNGRRAVSFSSTGLFAYVRGSFDPRRLVWVNRAGTIVGFVGQLDTGGIANPELSPDGKRVAVTRRSENSPPNVWLIDIDRGVPTRFTFGSGNFNAPFWSPDGKRVLFRYQAGGAQDLFVKAVDGLSDAKPLYQSKANNKTPSGWSPDGRAVLYVVPGDDLMAVEVESGKSFPIAATAANEGWGEFSPDGRFVAYQSNESGRFEIYVRTFPGADGKWLASEEGGTQPRWRRDGKELYYVAPDNDLMAVPVVADKTGRTLRTGKPLPLFHTKMVTAGAFGVLTVASGPKQQYAVAPDGRFLMIVPVAETAAPAPISIVVNWPATLKR
jgi:serine/threonine protein kinase/Tol biopolymer transport system component